MCYAEDILWTEKHSYVANPKRSTYFPIHGNHVYGGDDLRGDDGGGGDDGDHVTVLTFLPSIESKSLKIKYSFIPQKKIINEV